MINLIMEWWHDSYGLNIILDKLYSVQSLKELHMLVVIMLCRLNSEKNYEIQTSMGSSYSSNLERENLQLGAHTLHKHSTRS
jgi:hypothetical protein